MDAQKLLSQRLLLKQTQIKVTRSDGSVQMEEIDGSLVQHLSQSSMGFVVDTKVDDSLDEIVDGIYLGSADAALNSEALKEEQITHILNVAHGIASNRQLIAKHVDLLDTDKEDLTRVIPECLQFIDKARSSDGRILVHCQMGVSRSPSIVIAYLMCRHAMTFEEALKLVKSKRAQIQPNKGFISQLKALECLQKRC